MTVSVQATRVEVVVTSPTEATITAAAAGPQGPTGASPIYSRAGQLATLIGQGRIYFETPATIAHVRASVGTAPVGAPVVLDVNVNGATIYTDQATRPTIAAGSFTTTSAPGRAVSAGDFITVDIDSVGTTNPGADLTVTVALQ